MYSIRYLVILYVPPVTCLLQRGRAAGQDAIRGDFVPAGKQGARTDRGVVRQYRTFQYQSAHADPCVGTDGDGGITFRIPPPRLLLLTYESPCP